MIQIKDKFTENTINLVKDSNDYSGNYSILFQNTLTKNIEIYLQLEDTGNKMFYTFENIGFNSMDDGEYYLVLIENPNQLRLITDRLQPNKIKAEEEYIYVTFNGDYITNASFFIVNGGVENQITPVCSQLLCVGEYEKNKTSYKANKQYLTYERK
jgi:hypothetical protein